MEGCARESCSLGVSAATTVPLPAAVGLTLASRDCVVVKRDRTRNLLIQEPWKTNRKTPRDFSGL